MKDKMSQETRMVVDKMLDFFGIEMLRPLRHPNFKGSRHTVAHLCRGREGFYLKTTNQVVSEDGKWLEVRCRKSGCGWKLDFNIDASSQLYLGAEPVVKDGKHLGYSPERYTKLDEETRQEVVAAFKD